MGLDVSLVGVDSEQFEGYEELIAKMQVAIGKQNLQANLFRLGNTTGIDPDSLFGTVGMCRDLQLLRGYPI